MISIPLIDNDPGVLAAAQLYAVAGLYVGPLHKGTKNPGSVLGKGWQHQSSLDVDQIEAWFTDSEYDLFVHAGRSGLVVFDVDYPDRTPDVLARHLSAAPYQSTRPDQPGRGHYLFAQPPGRAIGNGQGRLGSAWGDVRGLNGVIVVAPSDGGRYRWMRAGPVPVLPSELAEQLGDGVRRSGDELTVATDAQVALFVETHADAGRPAALDGRVKGLGEYLAVGNGRHTGSLPFITGAMEEAHAGLYPAQDIVDRMWPLFRDAALSDGSRTESSARSEFGGLLAWAVARATESDPDEVRERVEAAMGTPLFASITANARNSSGGEIRDTTGELTPKAPAPPRVWRSAELTGSAPLEWLGNRHVPEAAVTLLTGDEGIGKSLLWVLVVAAVTTGAELPALGIPARDPRHVLVVVTEDDWSAVVRPRLELAGADLDYVGVLCSEPDGSGSPYFPRDINIVAATVPPPYLIVIDAWADTVEGQLSVKDGQQARIALHPWKEVATKLRAAVLLLTHTNRAGGTSIRDRYALTNELRKKARMALFAQQDDEGNLVVGPDKSNLVGRVPAAVFRIVAEQVFDPTASSDGTVPRLEFVRTADFTAAELLAESSSPPPREGETNFPRVVLSAILADGKPHDREEVIEKMAAAGVPERTSKRAAKGLGVITHRSGFGERQKSTWQLPVGPPDGPPSGVCVSTGLSGPTGPTGPPDTTKTATVRPLRPDGPHRPVSTHTATSGPTDEVPDPTAAVEKADNVDRNGWPLCAGGCGLGINPALGIGDRHEFCR